MRFDVYGRFQLDISRESDVWVVYRVGDGGRRPATDLVIPSTTRAADVATYLDDLLHELARPGETIRRL